MKYRISPGVFLALAGALMTGGCGFTPLYGKADHGAVLSEDLSQVYVENILGRYGQQVRLALQKDLTGAGPENPQRYSLRVNAGANTEAIDIHDDNTSGRNRIVGLAHWQLYTVEQMPRLIAEGDARSLDGYDSTYQQYFAQTLNDETAKGRVADTLAQNITQQLAIWFRTHRKPSVNNADDSSSYVDVDAMPTDNGPAMERAGTDGFPASAIGRLPQNTTTSQ